MKRTFVASLAALVTAIAMGCQPTVVTTPAESPHREKDTDIKIRTPGVDVDVQGKGDGKGIDVDVRRKGTRR